MTENKMQNLTPTEAKVYDAICEILTGDFEIPAEKLRWDGLLYEDYDIDSIDAVDMIVHLKFQVSVGFRREKRRGTVPHQGAGRQNNPSIIAVQMGFHG